MKFSIKDFFSKGGNFIFCKVTVYQTLLLFSENDIIGIQKSSVLYIRYDLQSRV